ncbi:MAG TPA: enoyl-CoA hydratase [Thermoanaerobaculia bacterium]|jgi:enoyl-CoA hydratase/carnithine racemase|nr:enoyl-CoA hydratase [Thermoanaerobaculia bacterium]
MSTNPIPAPEPTLVLRESSGGVVRLTLNRGERYNPLSSAMITALQAEVDATAADPDARVVVLAASGRGFSAGHDLKEMRAHASEAVWQTRLFDDCNRLMLSLTRLPQPVIARVHGIATAAGCQLVSTCDLAVASDTATFALPGVNIGVFCTTPAVGVGRNVSRKRAMEMLLTGKPIDAATALAWGLVNRVVPAAGLDAAVQEFVDAILAKSTAVIARGKRAFYDQLDRPLADAYAVAGKCMAEGVLLEDAAEGMDAFLQKRAPAWRGR